MWREGGGFSIGFGQPIVKTTWGETEYRIAWIPFGGYVKFLGQMPGEDISVADRGRALHDKSPIARIFISAAGPVMNLLLPFAIIIPYVALSDKHQDVIGGQVGAVDQEYARMEGGDSRGDVITTIDDVNIHSFWQVKNSIESYQPNGPSLSVKVLRGQDKQEKVFKVSPQAIQRSHPFLPGFIQTDYLIGYQPDFLNNSIALKSKDGPLASAGLKTFDRVMTVNGIKTPRFIDVISALENHDGQRELTLSVERTGASINGEWSFIRKKERVPLTVPPSSSGHDLARNLRHAGTCITSVAPDTNAHTLLKPGDCLISVDGKAQSLGAFLIRRLRNKPHETKRISWLRDGQTLSGELKLSKYILKDPMAGEVPLWRLGFSLPQQVLIPASKVKSHDRLGHGWYEAKTQVPREIEVILRSLGGMFSGSVSPTQLSGPLAMFHLAGSHARAGLDDFLRLMALLSLSIGLFNLLPIPLLDGGHILVAGVELVTRRPLSEQMQARLQYVGLVLILALFLFALGNDAVKSWRLSNG